MQGTISECIQRYSFSSGSKYEEGRHQICIKIKKHGILRGLPM